MPMTMQEFRASGLLASIASVFDNQNAAYELLDVIDFPRHLRPIFNRPQDFWSSVAIEIVHGRTAGGLEALLRGAAAAYPHSSDFAPYRAKASKNEHRDTSVSAPRTQADGARRSRRSNRRQDPPDTPRPADSPGDRHSAPQESAGSSLITRLVVEVRNQQFEVDEPPPSRRIGELRSQILDLAQVIPVGGPRRARVLRIRRPNDSIPLRLEASLAEAGLSDGDLLRLSLMDDEEGGQDDADPFLKETLGGFYSGRLQQLRSHARRVGIDRSLLSVTSEPTRVEKVIRAVCEAQALPDLTLLAAAGHLEDTGLRAALARLAWYGSPHEVAPRACDILFPAQLDALESVWPSLSLLTLRVFR